MKTCLGTTLCAVILVAAYVGSVDATITPPWKTPAPLLRHQASPLLEDIPRNGPLLFPARALEGLKRIENAMPSEKPPQESAGKATKALEQNCPGGREKTGEAKFGDYLVRTFRLPEPEGCFVVVKGGRKVLEKEGWVFQIGGSPGLADQPKKLIRMGRDVTGLGKPNLVVGEWTGGAHCCIRLFVYELGPELREVARIDAQHSDLSSFEDVNGDGKLEFVTNDWTFAYWRTAFAYSPAPKVILRFRDGAFRLALELMREPAPSPDEQKKRAEEVRRAPTQHPDEPPSELWGEMLGFIYSGNAPLAWQFLEMAWPPERKDKEEFLRDFRERLATSPYWRDLRELNGGRVW